MTKTIRGKAARFSRRTFIVGSAAAGGGLALGFNLPSGFGPAVAQSTNEGAEAILAQIQARFGDLDSAFAALRHLLEVPAGLNRSDLRFDPAWDPLRKDPRFQELLDRLRFPQ